MEYIVGIDTGGTFTDIIVIDDSGSITSGKSPTTPDDLAGGVMRGIERAAAELGLTSEALLASTQVVRFSGTTATNALLTRTGDPAGMIVTRGFEDTLAIARASSSWTGLTESDLRRVHRHKAVEPLVGKPLIRGVTERIDSSGAEVITLDRDGVVAAAEELQAAGVGAIAVCFLWSIRNPEHELEAAALIRERFPELTVHCSHEVAPAVGEYERFTTTVADAYVSPVLTRFLAGFQRRLDEHGFKGQLLVAQADGGALYPDDARPVYTLHSGPAGGVIASKGEGERIGFTNIVTTDVGGTSFDVGLVAAGEWTYAREPELGGLNLSVPMIEVASIGAGGGSVAWVDDLGVLHVGPRSAGSVPGPACYGRGGTEPTVTDADLVLGYLDPEWFLGGRMHLDRAAAEAALESVAAGVGLDVVETAAGIFSIANAHMADLLTRQVVARGYDPRDFVIFAYGGAGPMHSAFYGAEAGAREVIVPGRAGTFSALGVATAPLLHSAREHMFSPMPIDPDEFNATLQRLEATVSAALDKDGIDEAHRDIRYVVEMRYGMQVHTARMAIARKHYDAQEVERLATVFDETYERLYGAGSGFPAAGRFLTGYIVDGYGRVPTPSRPAERPAEARTMDERARIGTRDAYFDGGFVPTGVYRYAGLHVGDLVEGPAIVEAAETTVVIPPRCAAKLDGYRNLRLTGLENLQKPMDAPAVTGVGLEG